MFSKVRLEAARSAEFPEGSAQHGYELQLPLDTFGRIDHEAWRAHRPACTFTRFWGDTVTAGRLQHGHRGWVLSTAPGTEDDEVLFRGDAHQFVPGEYVTLIEPNGSHTVFKVARVQSPE